MILDSNNYAKKNNITTSPDEDASPHVGSLSTHFKHIFAIQYETMVKRVLKKTKAPACLDI